MALMYRIRTVTTGLAGGPYLSTHCFQVGVASDITTSANNVQAFWFDIRNAISSNATMTVSSELEVVDPANGQIVSTESFAPTPVAGTNVGANEWTAKQGLLALRTPIFRSGRRIQGHLYIPGVTVTSGEQTPNPTYTGILNFSAEEMTSRTADVGTPWAVWSRPSAPGANDGRTAVISNGIARGKWAVLRSRRD